MGEAASPRQAVPAAERWNHNIHYHPLILGAVPAGCRSALDVGCGEGLLARQLSRAVPRVWAVDSDEPTIGRARRQDAGCGVTYLHGDFLTQEFEAQPFGMIVSVAALHHMDAGAALWRMRELLAPGGTLVVVGLARNRHVWAGLPLDAAGVAADRWHRTWRTFVEVSAPTVWPPPVTYGEMRDLAGRVLPGVRYRRHVMWRYSLVWTKPPGRRLQGRKFGGEVVGAERAERQGGRVPGLEVEAAAAGRAGRLPAGQARWPTL